MIRGDRSIYVPDKVQAKPPLVVVIHSCQSSGEQYFRNSKIPWKQGSDGKGYITIWPSSPNSGGCWDVSSTRSLRNGGGRDSQAIANMIEHGIQKYNCDPPRVYVTCGRLRGSSLCVYISLYRPLSLSIPLRAACVCLRPV